jgi:hypothetical protein
MGIISPTIRTSGHEQASDHPVWSVLETRKGLLIPVCRQHGQWPETGLWEIRISFPEA